MDALPGKINFVLNRLFVTNFDNKVGFLSLISTLLNLNFLYSIQLICFSSIVDTKIRNTKFQQTMWYELKEAFEHFRKVLYVKVRQNSRK